MLAWLEHWVVEISLENSLNIFSKGLIENGYDRKTPLVFPKKNCDGVGQGFETKSPVNE